MKIFFIFTISIHLYFPSSAQEFIEENITSSSTSNNAEIAKNSMIKQSIEKTSIKYIENIIGPSKVKSDKSIIYQKVLPHYGKYIPFIKSGILKPTSNGFQMDTTLQISLKELRNVLLNEGLLYEIEGPLKILPMIEFVDQKENQTFQWWTFIEKKTKLYNLHQRFYIKLKEGLKNVGYYLFLPIENLWQEAIPSGIIKENLGVNDSLILGDFYNCTMIIRGYFILDETHQTETKVKTHLDVIHVNSLKNIAQISRDQIISLKDNQMDQFFDEVVQSLSIQLLESLKRGTIGSIPFLISIKGLSSPPQIEKFKENYLRLIPEIKIIRERRLTSSERVYEVEASKGALIIGDLIAKRGASEFEIKLIESDPKKISLEVKSKLYSH